jgi:muramoyltetrapeptide carboxypeptidase
VIVPPPLRPGDVIAVVAPSSPFDPVLAWVAMGWLARRYRVQFHRGIFAKTGYLAGSDERRCDELRAAMAAPEVRAILAARGGYGAPRFAHMLDWGSFAERPKWIIGFSDITALHVEASRAGVASIHGPNLTTFGRADGRARDAFVRIVESPLAERAYRGLRVIRPGAARGPLFGGNLTMLHAAAAAGRLDVPEGAVLFLEDVTERPYRIDRALATLGAGGHLSRASAVVLGDFTQCDPGPDGITVDEVLRENLSPLGVPVVAGLPVGHGTRNDPVVLGAKARVSAQAGEGTLSLGEAG